MHWLTPSSSIFYRTLSFVVYYVKFYETNNLHLFDLSKDMGEKNDLSDRKPEVVEKLHDRLNAYLASVDAQMPQPNPNYDPSKPADELRRRNNRRRRTQ